MNELRAKLDRILDDAIQDADTQEGVDELRGRILDAVTEYLHGSIMEHKLKLGSETDQTYNYARVHHWIDDTIQAAEENK